MVEIATCKLKSTNPVTFGKWYQVLKEANETSADYEMRTWRERAHYDTARNNEVYIPCTMFTLCIKTAAKYMSPHLQIPGKGKARYTKIFESGVQANTNLYLGITKDETEMDQHLVPADGKRGGTTRVVKSFPMVREWEGTVDFLIYDDQLSHPIFEMVLKAAGELIGIGTWRPNSWGSHGTFKVVGEVEYNKPGAR